MNYCKWCGEKTGVKLYCSKSCTQKYHHKERRNSADELFVSIPCLTCHKLFKSEGIHNRICHSCKAINKNKSDFFNGYGFGINSRSAGGKLR